MDNDTNCIFLDDPRNTAVSVMSGTSAISAVSCVMAICLLVFQKLYHRFKYRLMCHLLLSAAAFSIALIFELVTINYDYNNSAQVQTCEAVGYFVQWTVWIQLLFQCTFVLYITVGLYRSRDGEEPDRDVDQFDKWDVSLFFLWFIPSLYSWIPFLHETYGLAGPWCWIRIQDEDCNTYVAGIVEQFLLWYIFVFIFSFVNTTMIIIFLFIYIRRNRRYHRNNQLATHGAPNQEPIDNHRVPEGLSLIPYLVIYQILTYISLFNRLYRAASSDHDHTNAYGLWIAQAIAVASYGLFASAYFFAHSLQKYITRGGRYGVQA